MRYARTGDSVLNSSSSLTVDKRTWSSSFDWNVSRVTGSSAICKQRKATDLSKDPIERAIGMIHNLFSVDSFAQLSRFRSVNLSRCYYVFGSKENLFLVKMSSVKRRHLPFVEFSFK